MRPPEVALVSPAEGSEVTTPEVQVRFQVQSASDLVSVLVTHNGRPVSTKIDLTAAQRGDPVEATVPLAPGDNLLAVTAENQFAYSKPATVTVRYRGAAAPPLPRALVLAIGVSDYEKKAYQLLFAAKDAEDFAKALKGQEGRLWREVQVNLLTNRQATRANLLEALEALAQKATPEDVVMIFLSGHGVQDRTGDFYLVPWDGDLEKLRSTGVNLFEFEKTIAELPSKVLVLIDACHAGAVDHPGWKGIEAVPLIRAFQRGGGGVTVLSSSTGAEESREHEDWQHGAFTYALLEGLQEGKADLIQDGVIQVSELLAYVKNRVPELTRYLQHPTTYQPQSVPDFAVWKVQ
jgi:hypothetical protein